MKKNEKVVFNRYDLRLKSRDYSIIIPTVPPKEAYVQPYVDPPFLDGNHVMYKTLRAVCVALIRESGLIAYIPSRKNGTLYGMRNDAFFPHTTW